MEARGAVSCVAVVFGSLSVFSSDEFVFGSSSYVRGSP